MPNWIRNRVLINGTKAQVKRVLDALKRDKSDVDFNRIIPVPESLTNAICGSPLSDEQNALQEENVQKYGYPTWYEFCVGEWGCKWNAHKVSVNGNIMEFETPWSMPDGIAKKLSEMFPEVTLEWMYADEDTGYNVGEEHYKAGEVVLSVDALEGTREAYDMAFELWPESREYYMLVDGEYVPKG